MGAFDRLHQDIDSGERLALIRACPIAEIVSAPGHRQLRSPEAVRAIALQIERGAWAEVFRQPVLLGLFTREEHGAVLLRAVECLDGHHRLLAALLSGRWRTLGDLPAGALDLRVNGWPAGGFQSEGRWIPLEVAEASTLPRDAWFEVPEEWGAKGRTAQIPGSVSSLDPVFPESERGVPLGTLLRAW
jgi:hypothetical protein